MEDTLSLPLICSRFQTPRNVPGKTMKMSPEVMKAITRRDSDFSRARAISKTFAGDGDRCAAVALIGSMVAGEVCMIFIPGDRPRLPTRRRAGKECCFPDARAGEGPLRIHSAHDRGLQRLGRRWAAGCSRCSRC